MDKTPIRKSAHDTKHPMTSTHLRKDVPVKVSLYHTHIHAQDTLALRQQRRELVALEPAQHGRLELLVQLLDLHFMIRVVEIELVRQLD